MKDTNQQTYTDDGQGLQVVPNGFPRLPDGF